MSRLVSPTRTYALLASAPTRRRRASHSTGDRSVGARCVCVGSLGWLVVTTPGRERCLISLPPSLQLLSSRVCERPTPSQTLILPSVHGSEGEGLTLGETGTSNGECAERRDAAATWGRCRHSPHPPGPLVRPPPTLARLVTRRVAQSGGGVGRQPPVVWPCVWCGSERGNNVGWSSARSRPTCVAPARHPLAAAHVSACNLGSLRGWEGGGVEGRLPRERRIRKNTERRARLGRCRPRLRRGGARLFSITPHPPTPPTHTARRSQSPLG